MRKLNTAVVAFICAMVPSLASATNILSIGIGTSPNDTTGDPLRTAMSKIMTAVNGLGGKWSGTTAPTSPMQFQEWFDTSASPASWKIWDGTAWVATSTLDTGTHVYSVTVPAPTSSVLGGIKSSTCSANNFSTGVNTSGVITCALPTIALATQASGTLAIANGGTSQTTAAAARGASGLNVEALTSTGDANYTILSTDRVVAHNALSAARTDTLPAASSVNAGREIEVKDQFGVVTGSNTLTIQRAGADTINGGTNVVLNTIWTGLVFTSDGVSKWNYTPNGLGSVTSVATDGCLSGGTITTTGTLAGKITHNPQSGTTYTVVAGDKCKLVSFSNAAGTAVTLPQAGGSFPAGWYLDVQNTSLDLVTITPTTSTIDGVASLIVTKGYGMRIISDGSNYQIRGLKSTWARVQLNKMTASSSANLQDTTSFMALYTEYEIVLENIIPATTSTTCQILVQEAGTFPTTSYITAGNYVAGNATNNPIAPTTYIPCSTATIVANSAPGVSGSIRISNPLGTTEPKMWFGHFAYNATTATFNSLTLSGYWNGNAAITGFQVGFNSGNITSGVIKVYGWN